MKVEEVRLDVDQIFNASKAAWDETKMGFPFPTDAVAFELAFSICQTQLQRIIEWGDEECPHERVFIGRHGERTELPHLKKHECPHCWDELKQAVKGGEG